MPKNCVATIEMRLRRMRDEPLRATRVFARQSHPDRAPFVRNFVNLATDLITGAAVGIPTGIARLNYEVRNDAWNRLSVKEPFLRKLNKIINRQWRILRQELDYKRALAGFDRRRDVFAHTRNRAPIIGFGVARHDRPNAIRKVAGAVRF